MKQLTSVDHDTAWHARVTKMIADDGCTNVSYLLREPIDDSSSLNADPYLSVVGEIDDRSIDFALIDGVRRDACAWLVIPKLRRGGLLVIDNVNRYLPSNSIAPRSRSFSDGPSSHLWGEVHKIVKDWRVLWTSSGVTDTAIYFKP
jgi:predicted O-methyltransferase YrrM